jgi:hypothetical protein
MSAGIEYLAEKEFSGEVKEWPDIERRVRGVLGS